MKLELEQTPAGKQITGHGPGWLAVNGERHEVALQVSNTSCVPLEPTPATVADLDPQLLDAVVAAAPAVVLFGSGATFAQAPLPLVAKLAQAGIGAESMDTIAAARTFNLLVAEGRQVIAFLLPPV